MGRLSGSPATPETHTAWQHTVEQNRDNQTSRTVPADTRGFVSRIPAPNRSLQYSTESSNTFLSCGTTLVDSPPHVEERPRQERPEKEEEEEFGGDSLTNHRADEGNISRNSTGQSSAGRGNRNSDPRNTTQIAKNKRLNDGSLVFAHADVLRGKIPATKDGALHTCRRTKWLPKGSQRPCWYACNFNSDKLRDRRELFSTLSSSEKTTYVKDVIRDSIIEPEEGMEEEEQVDIRIAVQLPNMEERVCLNCLAVIFLLQKTALTRMWREATHQGRTPSSNNVQDSPDGGMRAGLGVGAANNQGKSEKADAYIETWIADHGEPHPRRDEIMLDKCEVKAIYEEYTGVSSKEASAEGVSLGMGSISKQRRKCNGECIGKCKCKCGLSLFYKRFRFRVHKGHLYNKAFTRVRFTKYKAVSSKCFSCSRLRTKMNKLFGRGRGNTAEQRRIVKEETALHRRFFVNERILQNKRVCEAMDDPERIGSVVMDGMDGTKTLLPSFPDVQGELIGLYKNFLKVKLTGVLIHGFNLNMFPTMPWIGTGANLCATTLIHTLVKWQHDERNQGRDLPRTLNVLVDGGPENVNITMMALFAWLVTRRVFSDIYVSRLIVGHTHNDLDQRWSVVAQRLHGRYGKPAETLAKFYEVVRSSFCGEYNGIVKEDGTALAEEDLEEYIVQGGMPVLRQMDCTYDYVKFLGDVMNEDIEGHASCKRLSKKGDGSSGVTKNSIRSAEVMHMHYSVPPGESIGKMRYKTAAQYPNWHPEQGGWINLFKDGVTKKDLPKLSQKPELANFMFHEQKVNLSKVPKKGLTKPPTKLQACAKTILTLHRNKPEHFSEEHHDAWVEFIKEWPEEPEDVKKVPEAKQPLYALRATLAASLQAGSTRLGGARAGLAAGCTHDAQPVPMVPSMTDSKVAAKAKKATTAALLAGNLGHNTH
jgi:hypothetical protein